MMRWAAALALLMSAAPHARGDDAYPTQLVDRAPFLPAGTTEASASMSQVTSSSTNRFSAFDLDARRSFGAIEPFVSVLTKLGSTAGEDRIASVTGGAAVPLTRTADLRAGVSSINPFDGLEKGYRGAIAYEGRYALVPHWFAISGAVGGAVTWVRADLRGFPPDLATVTTTDELAFARGVLEVQDTEHLALWIGVELDVEHDRWAQAMLVSSKDDRDAICSIGLTYATPHVDVGAQTLRRTATFETTLAYIVSVAARF